MPISEEALERFDQIFGRFDPAMTGFIEHEQWHDFLNAFMEPGEVNARSADVDEQNDNSTEGMRFITAPRMTQKMADVVFESFDLKRRGKIPKDLCKHCLYGLAGHVGDFTLKLAFRFLDKNRDRKLSHNELRESRRILGSKVSEDELMAKWEKKLGRKVDNVKYSEFYFLVKGKEYREGDAYDMFKSHKRKVGRKCEVC